MPGVIAAIMGYVSFMFVHVAGGSYLHAHNQAIAEAVTSDATMATYFLPPLGIALAIGVTWTLMDA
jgi:hypothetical protein